MKVGVQLSATCSIKLVSKTAQSANNAQRAAVVVVNLLRLCNAPPGARINA